MTEAPRHPRQLGRHLGQALFAALFLGLLFLRLMPLAPGRMVWPGPDLALCLALAWILRRPDQAPVLLIAALFLIEDIMLWRPPGLWTAIIVIGTEAARKREGHWRELPFVVEWMRVALLVGLMVLMNRFLLSLFLAPLPSLGQALMQYLATVATYPLVAGLLRWPLGLRRAPTET
ncbi:MAG: rod shape-determining protein MreD [Paracoccus sp. (in: a-proteobacteria)]|uniref:rod shape-determining protein MreD n=1 Tax=Paracoccus sp. TaxID=267 RepID=UPI0039E2C39D